MPGEKKRVVAVLYRAGENAKVPGFLGCLENGLGLRDFVESKGWEFIVTADKDGPDCELECLLPETNILITTPFHPAYMTAERIEKARKLELLLTAGVGSDHVDLQAAARKGLTVAECTGSNVVSVAEDEVMRILVMLRNYLPAWQQAHGGTWNVAEVARKAHDLQGKTVGTLGAGRIGIEMLKRLKAFQCNLVYYARHAMPKDKAPGLDATWISDLDKFLGECDVVSVNVPLSDKTRGMIGKEQLRKMKPGAVLINNARGAIVDAAAVAEACRSGHLAGYSGDVWDRQPPPKDHPWLNMPNSGMTPHTSGTTLEAQYRYSEGTKEMVEKWAKREAFPEENYIVREGRLASQYS